MRCVWVLLYACVVCLCCTLPTTQAFIQIEPNSGHFVDTLGRRRIFHGVNVVYKKSPWLPQLTGFDAQNSFSRLDAANLSSWGLNVVRYGLMWPGVETSPGVHNHTYLQAINRMIMEYGRDFGIYFIVDLHQDVLSPKTCGEGVPVWYVNETSHACNQSILAEIAHMIGLCKSVAEYGFDLDPVTGYPTTASCLQHPFFMFYDMPEVSSAFQHLWTNPDVLRAMSQYWAVVAQTFKDNPYVLGYDLFNEPWGGDLWQDNELLIPGVADTKHLQHVYDVLFDAVRGAGGDQNHIIMYEGTQFPDSIPYFGGLNFPNGFTYAPGTKSQFGKKGEQTALSYHVYSCVAGPDVCDKLGNPAEKYAKECDKFVKEKTAMRVKDAGKVKGGRDFGASFLTEFGACVEVDSALDTYNSGTSVTPRVSSSHTTPHTHSSARDQIGRRFWQRAVDLLTKYQAGGDISEDAKEFASHLMKIRGNQLASAASSSGQNMSLQGPLTESQSSGNYPSCVSEINRVTDMADTLFQSWAYWQYKYFQDVTTQSGSGEGFYHNNGALQTHKLTALTRTYAPIIAGVPVNMHFDAGSGDFTLLYATDATSLGSNSTVFVHAPFHYPSGFALDVIPGTSQGVTVTIVDAVSGKVVQTPPSQIRIPVNVVISHSESVAVNAKVSVSINAV